MPYFVDRLRAKDPNWEFAIIHIKGMPELPVGPGYQTWRIHEDFLIVDMPGISHPDPRAKAIADMECHIHVDEIVRIEFFTNIRAMKPSQLADHGLVGEDGSPIKSDAQGANVVPEATIPKAIKEAVDKKISKLSKV
jgi:hypothetical protein